MFGLPEHHIRDGALYLLLVVCSLCRWCELVRPSLSWSSVNFIF